MSKELTEFRERVYALVEKIPYGKATSYGAIAFALGSSPRAIGSAMKNASFDHVPAHRVCAADRRLGGFGGKKGHGWNFGPAAERKKRLLENEGVTFEKDGRIAQDHFLHDLPIHLLQTFNYQHEPVTPIVQSRVESDVVMISK